MPNDAPAPARATVADPVPAALRALAATWMAGDASPRGATRGSARGSERADAQSFLIALTEALGLPRPQPAGSGYEFERPVRIVNRDGSEVAGFVDCWKQGCFVLEAKATGDGAAGADLALRRAYGQARTYANHDPSGTPPPYLLVLDVPRTLVVWHRWGGAYQGYAAGHRIDLATLHARPDDVALLRDVWLDPARRDPRQRAQAVTRDIAARLARLAAALESRGLAQERVARFLMRCVFSMFAEDVGLLPREAFRRTVQAAGVEGDPETFAQALAALWRAMDTGGLFGFERIPTFNGHFFREPDGAPAEVLPLTRADVALLMAAAQADWQDVEPTIFGTLLTRALDPAERHRLGAEYTPRAFIERLVRPTVEEPVRARWTAVQAEVLQLVTTGRPKDRTAAEGRVRDFLAWLRGLRVLDPACGSGNFLYVTMHLLKDVEHEAVRELEGLTGAPELRMDEVGPWQFHGLEVKAWAREIAELTLWIGFHQYWRRHHAVQPPEPILRDTGTLVQQDAVLAWDSVRHVPERDRPDPTPRLVHPVTGELVPDPAARLPYMEYVGARAAEWPEADFIVGNPPYLGEKRQREVLGEGYIDAVRSSYPQPFESADLVMYWWYRAAVAVAEKRVVRAGLITTNSITQQKNRAVVDLALQQGAGVTWAAANHPWVDGADGAAVRVSMTVIARHPASAVLLTVDESAVATNEVRVGRLNSDLSAHADVPAASSIALRSNGGVAAQGFKLVGAGFVVEESEAASLLMSDARNAEVLRPFRNGRDLATRPRDVYVVDFGLRAEDEARCWPVLYDIVRDRVKPEREANKRAVRARYWWRFGEPNPNLREMLVGLRRYIATIEVSRHRFFVFLDSTIAPDGALVLVGHDDAFVLGVLSSGAHLAWASAAGGRMGVGDDLRYSRASCFSAFPFPVADERARIAIARTAESIDDHRRRALTTSSRVTMTGMYNVVAKLRTGEPLTAKEREIHTLAACGVLRDLHDTLDALVAEAYGWPWPLAPEAILERLVALHDVRVAEERAGLVRWLRPDYQQPRAATAGGAAARSRAAALAAADAVAPPANDATALPVAVVPDVAPTPWPGDAIGQITALRALAAAAPISVDDAVRRLAGARRDLVARHLETLALLGEVQTLPDARYALAATPY